MRTSGTPCFEATNAGLAFSNSSRSIGPKAARAVLDHQPLRPARVDRRERGPEPPGLLEVEPRRRERRELDGAAGARVGIEPVDRLVREAVPEVRRLHPQGGRPRNPPTTGLKYDRGTGIIRATLATPSAIAAAATIFPHRPHRPTTTADPTPARIARTPNAGRNRRTPSCPGV